MIAKQLGRILRGAGVIVWYDKKEERVGDIIHEKISQGLNNAQYFCIFLSKDSVNSEWVQDELRQAISLSHLGRTKVLLIMIDNYDVPGNLIGIHYATIDSQRMNISSAMTSRRVLDAIDHELLIEENG